jgi:hypothetical protein
MCGTKTIERRRSYVDAPRDQAKRIAKAPRCTRAAGVLAVFRARKIFVSSTSTGFARGIHRFSTVAVAAAAVRRRRKAGQ